MTQRVPWSCVESRRDELARVPLEVIEGTLPADLAGCYFVVAPVGTLDADGRPAKHPKDRTTLMNGDGLAVRVDFADGAAHVTTRLLCTTDYRADAVVEKAPDRWPAHRFRPVGIARFSPILGVRNFLNTAFQPMAFPGQPLRMLATYDAGRPWEIDPETLEVITPVGATDEWTPEQFGLMPFPLVLSPAHPMFDPDRGELWTSNYGRSIAAMMHTANAGQALAALPNWARRVLRRALGAGPLTRALAAGVGTAMAPAVRTMRAMRELGERYAAEFVENFTDVVVWDGKGDLKRVRMVDAHGEPVTIRQSAHQIAITRDHFVILDTGFKLGVAQLYNDVPLPDAFDELARAVLTQAQAPETVMWVARRDEILAAPHGGRVVAQRAHFPLESDHFLADWDDSNGRITVHVAHCPATDLSEWVRPYDTNHYTGELMMKTRLGGFLAVGAMDVGRLGRYVVDASNGAVVDAKVISDDRYTWALSLYAARAVGTHERPPDRIRKLFWASEGFFPELLTDFVYQLYQEYPHRLTPLPVIDKMHPDGRPSCVMRIDTESMRIEDVIELPRGAMASSLQFVPRTGSAGPRPGVDPDLDGYLVVVVFIEDRREVWVFDASSLAKPIARLGSERLRFGFSLHSAWVPSVSKRTAGYRVPLSRDLRPQTEPARQFVEQALRDA